MAHLYYLFSEKAQDNSGNSCLLLDSWTIYLLHTYNKNIHDLFKVAGLDRNVVVRDRKTRRSVFKPLWEVASSHMARRNFIGAAYQVVQDPDLISAMTGHVPGSNSFRRYRKVNNEMLRNIIDKM